MNPGLGSKGSRAWEVGKGKLGISCSRFTKWVLPKGPQRATVAAGMDKIYLTSPVAGKGIFHKGKKLSLGRIGSLGHARCLLNACVKPCPCDPPC